MAQVADLTLKLASFSPPAPMSPPPSLVAYPLFDSDLSHLSPPHHLLVAHPCCLVSLHDLLSESAPLMSTCPPGDASWIVTVKWWDHSPYEMEYLSLDCNRDLYSSPDNDLCGCELSLIIHQVEEEEEEEEEEDEVEITL